VIAEKVAVVDTVQVSFDTDHIDALKVAVAAAPEVATNPVFTATIKTSFSLKCAQIMDEYANKVNLGEILSTFLESAAGVGYSEMVAFVRCAFSDRNLHSRMPLDPTPARLKRTCV
jgi:hypothetical protein